jgi:osmoprotectant transport system ATP-binding protein
VREADVEHPSWVVVAADGSLAGWQRDGSSSVEPAPAVVALGSSLRDALAAMLAQDAGWVGVTDGSRYVGVLTPSSVHAALRRSVTGS